MRFRFMGVLVFVALTFMASAQDYNPYAPIGKKGKIVTLSKGKYVETFDMDSIQRIGSVLINLRSKRIVTLLNSDSVYGKYSDNSSSSRWYSIDPLADQFHSWSPYNFVYDNPIRFVDPDGRSPKDDYELDKKSGMIFMIRKTDDNHDVLYASNDEGKVQKDKSINVEKGVLNNIQHGEIEADGMPTGFDYLKTNEAQGSKLFEFLADHTDIEWGISKFADGDNFITTSREHGRDIGGTGILYDVPGILKKDLVEKNHSHPGGIDYPSGRVLQGQISKSGDIGNAIVTEKRFPNSTIRFNIYTPSNGQYHPYKSTDTEPDLPEIIIQSPRKKKN